MGKIWERPIKPLLVLLAVMVVSVIGFQILEGLNFFEALWLTVITILTVGYGDIVPLTTGGKIFALVIIPVSVGIFALTIGEIVSIIVEGNLKNEFGRKRMEKQIEKLKNHIIICGNSPIIHNVLIKLHEERKDYVIIDKDIATMEKFQEEALFLLDDPTEEESLLKAQIDKAAGVLAMMPDEGDNLLVVLTARSLNSKVNIATIAEKNETERKFRKAGATNVLNLQKTGGYRLAMSVLKPATLDYVDTVIKSSKEEFRVEEMILETNSDLADKTLRQSAIREKYGIDVMAIKRGDNIISMPRADQMLLADDILVIFGPDEKIELFVKEKCVYCI